MTLKTISRVKFYPFTHSYILDEDKVLIGVTQIMKKHGLSPDYSFVDEATLQHAADLGTAAHQAIETYCEGWPAPDNTLIRSFKKLHLNICKTEYLVSDHETVASSIDLVNEVDAETVDLIDMKRTSTVHKDALAWQLGIYRYLFLLLNPDLKVRKCYCLPIKKGNKDDILKDTCGSLVEITPVSEDKVKALLLAEKEGRIYKEEGTDENLLAVARKIEGFLSCGLGDTLKQIADLQDRIKAAEQDIAQAKESIYQEMLDKCIDKVEVDGVTISLKRPYQTSKLDTTALKKDHPELAEAYTKTSEVKGNITIKIK